MLEIKITHSVYFLFNDFKAGVSITTPTSIAVEQVVDVSKIDHVAKVSVCNNQITSVPKTSNMGQLTCITSTG